MPEQIVLLELDASVACESEGAAEVAGEAAMARLKPIDRAQTYLGVIDIENLIPLGHKARAIWDLTGQVAVREFLEGNKSVVGRAGAERTDPRWLVSVWVYGYSEGIGSARELARQMEHEPGLRWLSGGEPVNYHTLSDFRVNHTGAVEGLFAELLALLSRSGLIDWERVTQDGTKIETVAGEGSYRREPAMREHLRQAEALIAKLSTEQGAAEEWTRRKAAQRRAAEEKKARLEQALAELRELRKLKRKDEQAGARVSATEPESRSMKGPEGGFAARYNVQTTTEAGNKLLVEIAVTQQGSDQPLLEPAVERLERRGKQPGQWIVDGGYTTDKNILAMAEKGIDLIGPPTDLQKRREANERKALNHFGIAPEFGSRAFAILEEGRALQCPAEKRLARQSNTQKEAVYHARQSDCGSCPHKPQCCPGSKRRTVRITRQNPAVTAFHERMKGAEAKAIYRKRAEVAEFPHAWLKDKIGLRKFHVRGLLKANIEAKWAALTYNIQQWIRLCWRTDRIATA